MIKLGIISDGRARKSFSPLMHAAALQAAGLSGRYERLEITGEMGPALKKLWDDGFSGANVTVPHKLAVMPHLDGLAPEAEAVGAVNTLVRTERGFRGHNTDAEGFRHALGSLAASGAKAVIFGAGGAARAVLFTLRERGFTSFITGRDFSKTTKLARDFGAEAIEFSAPPPAAALLVNASSASSDAELGASLAWLTSLKLPAGAAVLDLNYGREQNAWADLAARNGARFKGGFDMLAAQARASFALWTGLELPLSIFREALPA